MSYSAVPIPGADIATYTAAARAKRLNKEGHHSPILGITLDLIFGALPWVVGSAALAAGLAAIYKNVDGASDTFALFNAPVAVSAIATFASFLLVNKQSGNLSRNGSIIGEFGNLSGSLINICLFLKSQISSGKSIEFLTLSDGTGGFFQTTRVGLATSSIMYIVKVRIRLSALPVHVPYVLPKANTQSHTQTCGLTLVLLVSVRGPWRLHRAPRTAARAGCTSVELLHQVHRTGQRFARNERVSGRHAHRL
jgi:hypothetical protein